MGNEEVIFYGLWEKYVDNWLSARDTYDILVVKYEDMIEDAAREVQRVASFLKVDIDAERYSDIAAKTSFSSSLNKVSSMFRDDSGLTTSVLRKGIVGDWKNNFNDEKEAENMQNIKDKLYQKHGL